MGILAVDSIKSRTVAPVTISDDLSVTGVSTYTGAITASGGIVGDVTGTATTATNAQGLTGSPSITLTDINVVGVSTFDSTVNLGSLVLATGGFAINSGTVTIPDKITHDGDSDTAIRFPSADTITAETGGTERLRIDSSGNITSVNTASGGQSVTLKVGASNASGANNGIIIINNGGTGDASLQFDYESNAERAKIYVNRSYQHLIIDTAGSERLRITSSGGVTLSNGELIEKCYINSTAWSTTGTVNLDNGMVQYNSANLAGTSNTLDIISSTGINTSMATGDMMSVTCITAVNASTAYVDNITIDGIAATESWVGGSAPSDGGSSGVDTYAFNIIKTADATFVVIANQVKTS